MKTSICISIGRNIDNIPMPEDAWNKFRMDVAMLMKDYNMDVFTDPYSVGGFGGTWEGVQEQCAIGAGIIDQWKVRQFIKDMKIVCFLYDQDTFGFWSNGELIKTGRKKHETRSVEAG